MFTVVCSEKWGTSWRVFHSDYYDGKVACFTGTVFACCRYVAQQK